MRIVFIGTGEIGVPALRLLQESPAHELVGVVTQPDKPVGRAQKITAPPIKEALANAGVPILQPAKIKEAVEEIRGWHPDVIVVMAYGQILPRALLEVPKIACLNLHASLLPLWRGAAPIQAAIASGGQETGITVMHMDAGLDTGDILLMRTLAIAPDETGGTLHDKLAQLAPAALAEALKQLQSGGAERIPQDNAQATYASKLEREDASIDWRMSAAEIERRLRAYDPWPGAFTRVISGSGAPLTLKIFRARVLPESGRPGSVLQVDGEIVIGAGDGSLALSEVQLAGKRRMSAAEFCRGFPGPLRIAE